MRVALVLQRDALLAFAGVLDGKLADIAQTHAIAEPLVREACLLHRLPSTSPAYGQGWNRLRAQTGGKFHALFAAVSRAMADTPRSNSLVENLNSRLRSYLTLRRHFSASYLDLLRFFLNHRRILRSRYAERQGKSPRELMTGQGHPHWLTLLGLDRFSPSELDPGRFAASGTRHPSHRNPAPAGRRFPRALCNPKRPDSEPRPSVPCSMDDLWHRLYPAVMGWMNE